LAYPKLYRLGCEKVPPEPKGRQYLDGNDHNYNGKSIVPPLSLHHALSENGAGRSVPFLSVDYKPQPYPTSGDDGDDHAYDLSNEFQGIARIGLYHAMNKIQTLDP